MSTPDSHRSETLSLTLEEQWALHHVLLDRMERMATDEADPEPAAALYQAFAALEADEARFSTAQLDAVQDVLADYQRAADWESERGRIESLLEQVTAALEADETASV